jgi:DNA-binding YbaB/EbfC family protein
MKQIQQLMKQAQMMQTQLAAVQKKVDATEVEAQAGNSLVKMTFLGSGVLTKITIDPTLMAPGEGDMLEDLIMAAHADGRQKIQALNEAEMKAATGGMGLPAGFKMPF